MGKRTFFPLLFTMFFYPYPMSSIFSRLTPIAASVSVSSNSSSSSSSPSPRPHTVTTTTSNGNNNGNLSPPPTVANLWQSIGLIHVPDWSIDVTSDECGTDRLKGEMAIFNDVEAYYRTTNGQRIPGRLACTIYQLRFLPNGPLPYYLRHLPPSYFCIPVNSIRKIEKVPPRTRDTLPTYLVDIICKDVRVYTIGFPNEALAEKMTSHIRIVAFPAKIEHVQAFADAPKVTSSNIDSLSRLAGWEYYQPVQEFDRIGITKVVNPRNGERLYRISDINKDYIFSPTYPAVLAFPERASDAHIQAIGTFRSKARVPALTWMHPGNKTTMWRCSQPKIGMGGNTCVQDEQLVQMIREANVHSREYASPLLLADCRPKVNAMANKAGGGGYEVYSGTQLVFLNIQNIHVVRESHRKMEALALSTTPQDINWTQAVNDSGWLFHLRTILSGAMVVAESMHRRGQCVLVHCSDGWDRTAQICGLAQIMMDPYYRTAKGYCILVAKEWCSFGHKFNDRAGHREEKDDGDISPVFLQFLDATWQLVRLFPAAFEFDGRFLLLIAHHIYSCRFGTFLGNNERERNELYLAYKTPSLWAYLVNRSELYRSHHYNPAAGDVLLPLPSTVLRHVTVWGDWFLRWSPFPSSPASLKLEKYTEEVYNHANVQAIRLKSSPVTNGNNADNNNFGTKSTSTGNVSTKSSSTSSITGLGTPTIVNDQSNNNSTSTISGTEPLINIVTTGNSTEEEEENNTNLLDNSSINNTERIGLSGSPNDTPSLYPPDNSMKAGGTEEESNVVVEGMDTTMMTNASMVHTENTTTIGEEETIPSVSIEKEQDSYLEFLAPDTSSAAFLSQGEGEDND